MPRHPVLPRFLLAAAFLTLTLFFGAKAQQTPLPASGVSTNTDFRNGLEQETFFLINHYREENKLPPMRWDATIAQLARAHSLDMATGKVDFGHDGFTERTDRLKIALPGLRGAGENVFKTDSPDQVAQTAVEGWLQSPHHLENIRGDYNYSGLGVSRNEQGVIYLTQIFVKLQPQVREAQASTPPSLITPLGILALPQTRPHP